jgi:hypothetical protein
VFSDHLIVSPGKGLFFFLGINLADIGEARGLSASRAPVFTFRNVGTTSLALYDHPYFNSWNAGVFTISGEKATTLLPGSE